MGATMSRWEYPGGPYTCALCRQECVCEINERVHEEAGALMCNPCYDMLSQFRLEWCDSLDEELRKLVDRAEQKLRDAYFIQQHPPENWAQHMNPIDQAKVKWGLE